MAIIVVCGSGRGVGKTALVCGLIAALPELRWTAWKITSHAARHGPQPIYVKRPALPTPPLSTCVREATLRAIVPPALNALFSSPPQMMNLKRL